MGAKGYWNSALAWHLQQRHLWGPCSPTSHSHIKVPTLSPLDLSFQTVHGDSVSFILEKGCLASHQPCLTNQAMEGIVGMQREG